MVIAEKRRPLAAPTILLRYPLVIAIVVLSQPPPPLLLVLLRSTLENYQEKPPQRNTTWYVRRHVDCSGKIPEMFLVIVAALVVAVVL